MKLPLLGLFVLAVAVPLRAQNLFLVVEDGTRYLVKGVENRHPQIVVDGRIRSALGDTFSFVKAPIYGLGVVDIGAFKVAVTSLNSGTGQPQLHVYGRLKADRALKHCFFVLRVAADAGKSVICDALPDFTPNQEVVYDSFFDLPLHHLPGDGHFEVMIFSNGLQLPTSLMSPDFVARQKLKTENYLQSHASH